MFRIILLLVAAIGGSLAPAWAGDAPRAAGRTIVVLGDSLSAAYGMRQQDGWVALLQGRVKPLDYSVANASISGETSAGGASRVERVLAESRPRLVIVALGSNDGLRGLPVETMKANLGRIVRTAQAAGARVLLVGSRMPPNYGPQYTSAFATAFDELAREFRTPLVPFLLEPIAARRELFQADNLHPTEAAQPLILENVWKVLQPMLR